MRFTYSIIPSTLGSVLGSSTAFSCLVVNDAGQWLLLIRWYANCHVDCHILHVVCPHHCCFVYNGGNECHVAFPPSALGRSNVQTFHRRGYSFRTVQLQAVTRRRSCRLVRPEICIPKQHRINLHLLQTIPRLLSCFNDLPSCVISHPKVRLKVQIELNLITIVPNSHSQTLIFADMNQSQDFVPLQPSHSFQNPIYQLAKNRRYQIPTKCLVNVNCFSVLHYVYPTNHHIA